MFWTRHSHLIASSCCLYTTRELTSLRLSNTCTHQMCVLDTLASGLHLHLHVLVWWQYKTLWFPAAGPAGPAVHASTHLDNHQASIVMQAQQGLEQPARSCSTQQHEPGQHAVCNKAAASQHATLTESLLEHHIHQLSRVLHPRLRGGSKLVPHLSLSGGGMLLLFHGHHADGSAIDLID